MENELEQVIQEWIAQGGRNEENIWGVRNFFTGIGRNWLVNQLSLTHEKGFNAGIEAAVKLIPFVGCCSEDEALFDQAKEAIEGLKK